MSLTIEIENRGGLVVVRQGPHVVRLLPSDCEAIGEAGRDLRRQAHDAEPGGVWGGRLDVNYGPDEALGGPADAHGCGRNR